MGTPSRARRTVTPAYSGYHPILVTRADTGEILSTRMRKGSANTAGGAQRFVRETIGRVRRAGATGRLTVSLASGEWNRTCG